MKTPRKRLVLISVFLLWTTFVRTQSAPVFSISTSLDSVSLTDYLLLLEDPTSRLTFSDIRDREDQFRPFEQLANPLDPEQVYWGKLVLKNERNEKTEWHLYPDWGPDQERNGIIEAYLPRGDSVAVLKTGQYVPASEKALGRGVRNKLPLTLPAAGRQEIYLRIEQINGYPPVFSPLLADRFFSVTGLAPKGWHIFQGVFQGMLWILILYFLTAYFTTRQTSYLYYVGFLVATSLYMLYLSDVFHEVLFVDHPRVGPYFWLLSSNILALSYLQFARHSLKTWEIMPRWDPAAVWLIRAIVVLTVIELILCALTFDIKLLNDIVNFSILFEVSFLLVIVLFNLDDLEIMGIAFLIGTVSMIAAGFVGVISEIFFSLDNVIPIIEGLFVLQILTFSFALNHQYTQTEKEKLEAQRKLTESLLRADKLKDTFLANTSHELRTPLHAIVGISETLQDQHRDFSREELESNLHLITASGRRLAHLVDDILDFSKLKSDQLQLRLKPVDLKAVVEVVLRMNAPLASGKEIRLLNAVPDDLPPVLADENRLQQILFNLMSNAIKFTKKGEVKVSARRQEDEIVVSVRDTGIGIPPEKQETIFQPFEQADGSITREFGGTGLGLTITRRLVELHGGQIRVASAPGKGATFWFTLPVSDQPIDSAPLSPKQVASVTPVSTSEEKDEPVIAPEEGVFHLLIVDDEEINHLTLKNYLREGPFRVTSAYSGEEALQLLEQDHPFDLVLLDVMMPHLSGYRVCDRIRQRYLASELPVIFITAKNQIKDLIQGFDYGANDYLAKPFSRAEFMARLRTHLNLHNIYASAARFVPSEFIHSLHKESILEVKLGDHSENNVTVFFSDIRSYTTLAEGMNPHENYRFVNAYAGRMGPVIKKFHGFVHQYLGDGIMALFLNRPDDALRAAVAMQQTLAEYNQERLARDRIALRVGMGLHTGELIMGIIGDRFRTDPAVISDTVNTASRMEGLTKYFGTRIIVSEYTLKNLQQPREFHARYLGQVQVKGKEDPLGVYEIFDGDPPELFQRKLATRPDMDEGLAQYYDRAFEMAAVHFRKVLEGNPDDLAARRFLALSADYMVRGVPEDWSGVVEMTEK